MPPLKGLGMFLVPGGKTVCFKCGLHLLVRDPMSSRLMLACTGEEPIVGRH